MKNLGSVGREEIIQSQIEFFGDLFKKYGDTPKGVSSESLKHKQLRYSMLANPIFKDSNTRVSIHDYGMGVGTFFEFLRNNFAQDSFNYSGSDIIEEYIKFARLKFPRIDIHLGDIFASSFNDNYDWIVLSGVFHQKRDIDDLSWFNYFSETIVKAFEIAQKGIAFNVVTPYVDWTLPNIYYADLKQVMDLISTRMTRFFTLQHAYPLYECTFHVFKDSLIEREFNQPEFEKYFKEPL